MCSNFLADTRALEVGISPRVRATLKWTQIKFLPLCYKGDLKGLSIPYKCEVYKWDSSLPASHNGKNTGFRVWDLARGPDSTTAGLCWLYGNSPYNSQDLSAPFALILPSMRRKDCLYHPTSRSPIAKSSPTSRRLNNPALWKPWFPSPACIWPPFSSLADWLGAGILTYSLTKSPSHSRESDSHSREQPHWAQPTTVCDPAPVPLNHKYLLALLPTPCWALSGDQMKGSFSSRFSL